MKKKRKKKPPKRGLPIKRIPPPSTPERVQEVRIAKRSEPKGKSTVVPPEESLDNNRYLRWSAGLYYTTDLRGVTFEQMSRHPFFGKVSMDTLARWSTQDRWVERRNQNLDNWRRAIENKIGSELVKSRTDQMVRMRELFDKIMDQVLKKGRSALKAKSLEGLVSALVKLADLMDNWNEKLFHSVIPDMPASAAIASVPAASKPRLSINEARAAAKIIMKMRRDEMRHKPAEPEVKPDLTVLEGDG